MNDLVKTLNGKVFANSQIVADEFGKTHYNILANIDKLIRNVTIENSILKQFFIEQKFINDRNREYRRFDITRDGFSLLVMSFTGDEALRFKLQFIAAFNKMESELKRQSHLRSVGIETRKTMTDKIKDTGENERMHGHGYSTYTKLAYKIIGIEYKKPKSGRFRDSLPPDVLEYLETVEGMIKELLKAEKQYTEIKQIIGDIFGDGRKRIEA